MASKQVSEILVRLGIQGLQGLDKLKSSFRELEKSLGPSASTIERARESIIAFGREGRNTEQVIKGQIEALRGLQSQTERGSTAWAELAGDIERFRQASRRTDGEIQVLRQSILSVAAGANQSQQSLRSYITDLGRLRGEATITGSVFNDLGRDIAELTARLQQAETQTVQTSRAFARVLGQALASTSAGARKQLQDLKSLIEEQRGIVDSIDLLQKRERELTHNKEKRAEAEERLNRALAKQRQLMYEQSVRTGREGVRAGAAAFEDPLLFDFRNAAKEFGNLPNTTAGLNQELAELSERLLNTNRSSSAYVDVSNRIAEVQRELRREITGTAEAFKQLDIAQTGAERRAGKLAGIQEYYSTQGPLAPGVGGYRDPVTGAIIARGARTPSRIRVDEAAYPTPIGPQPFPEMGRRAQESIERALDDVNRIYENAKVERAQIQAKYDQIEIDKTLAQADEIYSLQEQIHKKELNDFNRRLEARDKLRRRRLTTGQAVQSAGAIISGGIFGGPEGFVGGLGGFAAGLAIPGLGPVGGAFAGAAAGAQLGAIRQQLGVFAQQAAEISKLRRGLAGVSVDLNDFAKAIQATQAASDSLLIPLSQTIRFYTQLRASTVELNYSTEDTRQILEGTASAVLKAGGSLEDVSGAMRAVIQILSKGKVSAEEMRGQLGERLPGAVIKFAQVNNMSVQELDKAFESGQVTLDKFFNFAKKNYKDGEKYASDMATGTEFAGRRMEKALERLRLAIGRRLKESGAGFQNFVTEVVNSLLWAGGELERFGGKVEEFLGGGQTGVAGSSKEIAERIIGGGLSVQDLETAAEEYTSKINELEDRFAAQKDRNIFQQLFDETLGQGTITEKQLKTTVDFYLGQLNRLDAARRQAEKATREGKRGPGAGTEDPLTPEQREKLAQQYLQAVEQREESLFDARRQREEQIAKIRKDAVEQAAQIERQLGDERRQIERDIERTRREMEFGAGEIDRLRRLAAGEDPEVIEAERKAAEISQRATEDRIKIEEDLLDKELSQQRTIADFQKNTAKQIAEANENYAKRVGEIQRDFAKASAKIIEEGSGVAAKRITLAAQIVSQVLQRTSLNQQRTQLGYQPIGEPIGRDRRGQFIYYKSEPGKPDIEIPPQIRRIDENLEQLLRKLSASQGRQSSLPARSGIGEQFLSLLGAERGYEDVAGLMPLPIQRMQQQAARPLRMIWQQIQGAMEGVYRATEKEIKKTFKPDPARNQQVLRRIQRTQEAILNWNPLEAQWKETENQMREQKRSRTIPTPASAVASIVKTLLDPIVDRVNEAEKQSARLTPQLGSPEYARIFSANLGSSRDLSFMLSDNEKAIIKKTILDVFKATKTEAFSLPRQFTSAEQKINALNELSRYESKIEESAVNAANSLRSVVRNFPGFYEEVIQEARNAGEAFAEGALRNLGRFRTAPAETEQWLQEQRDRRSKQFSDIFDQPVIIPGVESQFEGAMLPGRGFNISRLTRNYGSIASASPGPLGLIAQAIQGAAPTSQLRQQGAQQQIQQINQNQLQEQFGVLSEITQTSRDTYKTLQDQTREIELQVKYLNEGHEPAIARELTTLQQSYETQKRRLQVQAQALINQGANVDAVTQQYNLELQNLDTLNKQNQQLAIQNEKRNKAIQDAQQLKDAVLNPLQQGFAQSFDLLINGTENWGNSLRQIAATVLQDIARQLIQIYVINQAISAIGKLFPTPGGTIPVAAVAANGMAFAKNGIQPFAMGGIVNKPTLFRYADGGSGRFGLMGEAGPEAIIPLKRGRDGKLGVAGGGTTSVTVNVDAQGTQVQGDDNRGQQLGRAVAAAVQAELIKQKRPGGLLA